jgi:hypothetical protein
MASFENDAFTPAKTPLSLDAGANDSLRRSTSVSTVSHSRQTSASTFESLPPLPPASSSRSKVKSRRFTVDSHARTLLPTAADDGPASPLLAVSFTTRLDASRGGAGIAFKPTRSRSVTTRPHRNSILDGPPSASSMMRLSPKAGGALTAAVAWHDPAERQWDSHVFRLKRREAQQALDNLPKIAALVRAELLRHVSRANAEAFEAKVREELQTLEEEMFESYGRLIEVRRRARAFAMWKFVVTARRLQREARLGAKLGSGKKMSKAPSFSSKLELLAQQGPRLEPRSSFRKFNRSDEGSANSRDSSSLVNAPPTAAAAAAAVAAKDSAALAFPDMAEPDVLWSSEGESAHVRTLDAEAARAEDQKRTAENKKPRRPGFFARLFGKAKA